jgi:nucleoside-diphosphate-sugar epimerase
MRVLVTGGTGFVGAPVVRLLLERGHSVRLLSRSLSREIPWANDRVERWPGDVTQAPSLRGSADDCDVVLHLVGIVDDSSPAEKIERVNVDGTRNVVLEAERAGVRKLVYVSSLGAERGTTAYHRSKRAAELMCRGFAGDWVIVRPGAAYGPGDQHVSVLLQLVRTLPAIPRIDDGEQRFQPIWHEDLARALAVAVEREDLAGRTLDVAGEELTSQNDLVRRMSDLVDRRVPQIPLPEVIASFGLRALDAMGIDAPFSAATVTMVAEGNRIPGGGQNALTSVLGITPLPLAAGLRRLLDAQPEQLPSTGVGALRRKRFWTDIRGSRFGPDELFEYVRAHFAELVPGLIGMNPENREVQKIEEGSTLTFDLPLRGHVQVRVAEVEARRITLLTVAGHPLAGVVRFIVEDRGGSIRFEVQVYERAARTLDLLLMRTAGDWLQRMVWNGLVQNVVRVSGGDGSAIQQSNDELSETEAVAVGAWAETLRDRLVGHGTVS